MSGIYIHIPFCKQACTYCNFHFSTSLQSKDNMIDAICKEIHQRNAYLTNRKLETIYFGGGTPSILDKKDLGKIFDALAKHYTWGPLAEITLEANPDDLNSETIDTLIEVGINRLSIGIQSFFDIDLQFMNRAHNADEASKSILKCQDAGLTNLSIDLIYGSPTTSQEMWAQNIEKTLDFNIPHISAYCLTVEEKTVLAKQIKSKKINDLDSEQATVQLGFLMDQLTSHHYDHYEISNFAKDGQYAIHNTNYWNRIPYLGIGPSAHSYDIQSRSWNVANNIKYIAALNEAEPYSETEILALDTQYNEYIMTRLRTMWGVDIEKVIAFGPKYEYHFQSHVDDLIKNGFLKIVNNNYILSQNGKYFADRIAMELFLVD